MPTSLGTEFLRLLERGVVSRWMAIGPWKVEERPKLGLDGDSIWGYSSWVSRRASSREDDATRPCDLMDGLTGSGSGAGGSS